MTSFKASQRTVTVLVVLVIAMAVQLGFLKSTNGPHSFFSSSLDRIRDVDTAGPVLKQVTPVVAGGSSVADTELGQPSASAMTRSNEKDEAATDITSSNSSTNDNDNNVTQQEPLNILIIFPDDWRYDAISDARPGVVFTPFLTQLAKQGIRFTQNFVTSSICWISRATLFSGRYASQHASNRLKCPRFTAPYNWNGSWPAILQSLGYTVAQIGKWQYFQNPAPLFNYSNMHEGHHWYTVRGKRVHANDRATDDAIEFLRKHRPKDSTKNWAMTVAYYPPKPLGDNATPGAQWEPHPDYLPPYLNQTFTRPYNFTEAFEYLPDFMTDWRHHHVHRFQTRYASEEQYQMALRNYFALVSHVDYSVKRIFDELRLLKLLNNTMIIVTADNGMMMGSHGMAGKWHPFEDSIRVPLIIYDPRMPDGVKGIPKSDMTLNIDLATTIVRAAGGTPDPRMQGRDMADLYLPEDSPALTTPTTKEPWRQDFFYEFPLEEYPSSTALRTRRYKYMKWPAPQNRILEQIFDLETDPYELSDLLHPYNATTSLSKRPAYRELNEHTVDADLWQLLLQLRERHDALLEFYTEPSKPKEECTQDDLPP
eukprot:Nitzschia sp. Nitz4//scaffold310_size27583//21944//23728//NITZ4_008179-RA/size27583-processed-gene-0.12-mRNA-1//-1//CDS//3329547364//4651//frame0